FADGEALSFARGVSSLIAQDIDADGIVDLAMANTLSGAIMLLKNSGGGSFTPTEVGRTRAPTLLISQDVNQDGTQDLVTVDAEGRDARVFANDGAAAFQSAYALEPSQINAILSVSLARE